MRAACEVGSISSTWSRCFKSSVTTGRSVRGGSTPPTTLDPPPQGIATALMVSHQSSTEITSVSVARKGDHVGRIGEVACEHARAVVERLAVAVQQALEVIGAAHIGQRARDGDPRLAQLDVFGPGRGRDLVSRQPEALRVGALPAAGSRPAPSTSFSRPQPQNFSLSAIAPSRTGSAWVIGDRRDQRATRREPIHGSSQS